MRETWVRALGREDPLEEEMAIHSSTVAWKIPWTEEPGMLQSMGRKELDTTERLHFTATAKLFQSCLTLCDPIDSSPPGSAIPRILQARTLEWVAISFSNA